MFTIIGEEFGLIKLIYLSDNIELVYLSLKIITFTMLNSSINSHEFPINNDKFSNSEECYDYLFSGNKTLISIWNSLTAKFDPFPSSESKRVFIFFLLFIT